MLDIVSKATYSLALANRSNYLGPQPNDAAANAKAISENITLTNGNQYFNTTTNKLRITTNGVWGDYDATAQVYTTIATSQAAIAQAAVLGLPYFPIINASTAAGGSNVLPQGITTGTIGGTAVTGATPGTYALVATGGSFTGVVANLVVTSATAASIVIANPGRTTSASPTAPTWANPSGATLPSGTTLTANIGTQIGNGTGQYYLTSDSTGSSLLYWRNTGTGAPVAVLDNSGAQVSFYNKASIDNKINPVRTSLAGWQTPTQTIVSGKYIQASDGSVQTSASFNYSEYSMTGNEQAIRVTAAAYLTAVAWVAWYNGSTFISGTVATASHVMQSAVTVTTPAGATKVRVTSYSATAPLIEINDVLPGLAATVQSQGVSTGANTTAVAAVKTNLAAWLTPSSETIVAGKYIQASDGSIQTNVAFSYVEYMLTGTELAIRVTADAYLTAVAWVAWYNASGTYVPAASIAATASHVGQAQVSLTLPTGAGAGWKLRVTSYNTTAPLIEINDVPSGLGTTALASASSLASVRQQLAAWQTPAQTVVTSKYLQASDGTIQTSAGFAYSEYVMTGIEQGFRVTVDAYLTATFYYAWYNAAGAYIAGSGVAATASHITHTAEVITPPTGAVAGWKLRVSGSTASFMPFVEINDVLPGIGQTVANLGTASTTIGASPTVYGFDYATGTAFDSADLTTTDYMILVIGTSWSGGYNQSGSDTPVTTTPVNPGYALMFDVGAYPSGRTVTSYVDLYEQIYAGTKETPCSGIASIVLDGLNARLGFKPRLIMAVGGKVGNAYAGGAIAGTGNKRGSAAYAEGLRLVNRAKQISAAAGRTLKVLAFVSLSGENEINTYPNLSERQFIDGLRQWRFNLEDDCRRITGQKEPIPFVTYQTSWTNTTTFAQISPVQSAQMKIHDRDPVIFQSGPVYYVAEEPALGHTYAAWYRRIGRQLGKCLLEGVLGPYYVPLQVIDAWWVSSTVFRLRYPEALALESSDANITLSTLANPAGKGIEFDDGSGSPPTISGVTVQTTILTNDTLEVTLASAPTGLKKRAYIAARYQSAGRLGNVNGGRSGIRSSASIDTDTLDSYALYKWAMAEMVVL